MQLFYAISVQKGKQKKRELNSEYRVYSFYFSVAFWPCTCLSGLFLFASFSSSLLHQEMKNFYSSILHASHIHTHDMHKSELQEQILFQAHFTSIFENIENSPTKGREKLTILCLQSRFFSFSQALFRLLRTFAVFFFTKVYNAPFIISISLTISSFSFFFIVFVVMPT